LKSIEVVAAIIKKDNQFLATQRGYGEFINMWEFPGGKNRTWRNTRTSTNKRNPRRTKNNNKTRKIPTNNKLHIPNIPLNNALLPMQNNQRTNNPTRTQRRKMV
jgi:hypothetical protein